MRLEITVLLVACLLFSAQACSGPNCGEFLAAVTSSGLTNCSVLHILTNAYIESKQPVEFCSDVGVGPTTGTPRTARDIGYGTGNCSFFFYTSGSGRHIHAVTMSKNTGIGTVSIKATLPAQYSHIIGLLQLEHGDPLYVATLTTLFAVQEDGSLLEVADLSALKLTHASMLTGAHIGTGADTALYIADQAVLHVVTLSANSNSAPQLQSVPLPPLAAGHLVTFQFSSLLNNTILALLDTTQLVTLDPLTARTTVLNVTLPSSARAHTPLTLAPVVVDSFGLPAQYFYLDGTNLVSLFLDPVFPPDVSEVDNFTLPIHGSLQYFL